MSWKPPKIGWITCNTDGASKENPGQSAYGFCVRNSTGNLIYAEEKSIGETTNMEAEAMAICKALQYCKINGFQQVKVETDSPFLRNMLIKNWRIPWEIIERVEDIQEIIHTMQIQVRRIQRSKSTC